MWLIAESEQRRIATTKELSNRMKTKIPLANMIPMILTGIAAGLVNVAFYAWVMHPLLGEVGKDEVAVSTYSINFFVGWVFFSAWFLSKADEEWKKTQEAVHKNDKDLFLLEAPKRIAPSIRVLYLLISVLVVLSFHLFRVESDLVRIEIQFGVGFLVSMTILVLWDLDDPIGGVIGVPNIPAEWQNELPEDR
jgi:hypothetical protein